MGSEDTLDQIENDLSNVEDSLNQQIVGQSFRQSIGSSIISLRDRLSRYLTRSADTRHLSERLEAAETAHNHRMPLYVLQQSRPSETPEEGEKRRRTSTLYASRSKAAEAEVDEPREEIPEVVMKEKDREEMTIEEDELDEIPLLLNNQTKERLRKSLDRSSLTRSTSNSSFTAASHVYSWGTDISLHEEKTSTALVSIDARVSKYTILSASASSTTVAVATSSGDVLMAGRNDHGQVDPLRESFVPKPAMIESLSRARILQVSCGRHHTAAVTASGSVLTWGSNEYGQLGHKDTSPAKKRSPTAMALGVGKRASAVACGSYFTMVLTTRMQVLVCGTDDVAPYGKLPSTMPVLTGVPIAHIAAGAHHAVVVSSHGTAYAWGENSTGCCGRAYPTSLSLPMPIQVPVTSLGRPGQEYIFPNWSKWDGEHEPVSIADDVSVMDAACGENFTVLVTRSGRLLVCGENSKGQLALSACEPVKELKPVLHPDGKNFITAEAGDHHAILLDDEGKVFKTGSSSSPLIPLALDRRIRLIAAGGDQTIAIAQNSAKTMDSTPKISFETEVSDGIMLAHSIDSILSDEDVSKFSGSLVSQTEELFQHPAVLNSLFLSPSECETFYNQIFSVDSEDLMQALATAMEQGITKGLEAMRSSDARTIFPESVRCLLLYLQNPMFRMLQDKELKFDYRSDLIMSLCEAFLSLPFEGHRALMSWATGTYTRDEFRRLLLRPLLKQFERGIRDGGGARTRAMPSIALLLRSLKNTTDRAEGPAKTEDYYSSFLEEINPEILYEDLMRHKKTGGPAGDFSICSFPFLMSPTCKRNLLQMEHQIDMFRVATSQLTWDPQNRQFSFEPFFVLAIDRKYLLQQTLQKIGSASPKELRKSLKIVFKGEDGVDAGGVRKEFFQLISSELFDLNTGMWSSKTDNVTWFNSDCTWNDDGFYLVGLLVGMALYNDVMLDVHFPTALYRKLLGKSLGLEDMFDAEVKKGLKQLLDYEGDDLEDIFCLNFDVAWSSLGQEKRVELKPGGSNIPVTQANKEEYVLLYVKWILVDSIKRQYELFERGVLQVLEGSSLDLLEASELELLVVGVPDLDFTALRENTEYEGGFSEDSVTVKNFWKFIEKADHQTLLQFLRFSTGSAKAPIGGLGKLPFKIQRAGPDSNQLPTTHTCFNTLLLPDYGDNYEKLERLLGLAVENYEGFGLQ